jgi:hypothetical protein
MAARTERRMATKGTTCFTPAALLISSSARARCGSAIAT